MLTLTVLAFRPLKGKLVFPNADDFKRLLRELLSISLAIYAVKVIYTMWEKSGPILLGLTVTPEMVGVFAFALLFAKKLMNISDAVTDINLPVFSDKYVHNLSEFREQFAQNFNKVFVFLVFSAAGAVFWSPELIRFVVGGNKYDQSFPLIIPLVFTFIFYSFINIIKSSVYIPAKFVREMVFSFVLLITGTILFYFFSTIAQNNAQLFSMSYGMLFGSFIGFLFLVISSQRKLNFVFFNHSHTLILIQTFVISLSKDVGDLLFKIPVFIAYSALFLWAIYTAEFVEKKDFDYIFKKIGALSKK